MEVVPAPGLRHVTVLVAQVTLADSRTGVIARCCGGKEPKHGQDPAANVLPVEVAAHTYLLLLELTVAEGLGGSTHAVVHRLIEIHHIVSVESDFRCEELRIQHSVPVARSAVEPRKVAERERSEVVHSSGGSRNLYGFRKD